MYTHEHHILMRKMYSCLSVYLSICLSVCHSGISSETAWATATRVGMEKAHGYAQVVGYIT